MSDSVQWTMLTPLLLTLVLGIIQVGLWGYAHIVVVNAAAAAAEEAAPAGASTSAGVPAAMAIAQKAGLVNLTVDVRLQGTDVVARVSGRMPGLIDVGITKVESQITRAKERVTRP